jgi:lambda repressor-like predicted transcriptional regulator
MGTQKAGVSIQQKFGEIAEALQGDELRFWAFALTRAYEPTDDIIAIIIGVREERIPELRKKVAEAILAWNDAQKAVAK